MASNLVASGDFQKRAPSAGALSRQQRELARRVERHALMAHHAMTIDQIDSMATAGAGLGAAREVLHLLKSLEDEADTPLKQRLLAEQAILVKRINADRIAQRFDRGVCQR